MKITIYGWSTRRASGSLLITDVGCRPQPDAAESIRACGTGAPWGMRATSAEARSKGKARRVPRSARGQDGGGAAARGRLLAAVLFEREIGLWRHCR